MQDWPAIVQQYAPLVWQTAYRLLGHEADAADCFQETFAAALRLAGREPVTNWAGLLQRIATTRALDLLRRRLRESGRQAIGVVNWEDLASSEIGPPRQAQASELRQRLREALGQLPPQQSEIFCLRHLSGLSYEQIAQELAISTDAVGVTLHRARAALRKLLASLWSGDEQQRRR